MQRGLESVLIKTSEKVHRLVLRGNIGIDQATEARDRLALAIDQCEKLVLDLTQVSSGDVTFLQVLVSANRSASKRNKKIRIESPGPSRELIILAAKAGFPHSSGEWLGMPIMEEAQ